MTPRPNQSSSRTEDLGGDDTGRALPVLLRAVDGPGAGAQVELSAGTVTVGSGADCDLVVPDKAVSRRHATLELLSGAVRVRDLQSRNGTLYLGARVSEALIPVGGSIQVGRTTVRIFPFEERALAFSDKTDLEGLIGASIPMRRLFTLAEQLAASDSTALIVGETGVGKEAVARAIHALSARRHQPFLAFDCAAVSSDVLDSELFGHVSGAFTGAHQARKGAVAAAEKGTLFLDEVGELPLELQPKLLRLLEQREYRQLGDTSTKLADIRVIASSAHDLEAKTRTGAFRQDLFYRVAVTSLRVPPLRERLEDVPLLARKFAAESGSTNVKLLADSFAVLQSYSWPGNVRELRNAVQRVLALGTVEDGSTSPQPSYEQALTPTSLEGAGAYDNARKRVLDQFEKQFLTSILEQSDGNMSHAGRLAGLSRSQLYRLLGKHKLGPFSKK
jgi:DNA-binding NtrC family response regulator